MAYPLKLPVGTLSEAKILLRDKDVVVWIEHPCDEGHRPGASMDFGGIVGGLPHLKKPKQRLALFPLHSAFLQSLLSGETS